MIQLSWPDFSAYGALNAGTAGVLGPGMLCLAPQPVLGIPRLGDTLIARRSNECHLFQFEATNKVHPVGNLNAGQAY